MPPLPPLSPARLQELKADPREASWAGQTRLQYYLVHRGDWPLSASGVANTNNSPLVPPVEMTRADTRWFSRPLTREQTRRKAQSIALYPSQTVMMSHFLNAFARSSELYGEIAPAHLARVADGAIRVDANPDDWQALPPCLLDPDTRQCAARFAGQRRHPRPVRLPRQPLFVCAPGLPPAGQQPRHVHAAHPRIWAIRARRRPAPIRCACAPPPRIRPVWTVFAWRPATAFWKPPFPWKI